MHILDEKTDKSVNRLTVYLTRDEAKEIVDGIRDLLLNTQKHHVHLSSSDYRKEITFTIYDLQNLESYDDRSKRLIQEDK